MSAPGTNASKSRTRQLRLLPVEHPFAARLGNEFFRSLPRSPGVYFFRDDAGALLYIGQSNNLRARISSYRHVNGERHARRTLRLVHRAARIDWQVCATHEEAQELERTLLPELRPPFNRAGVWKPPPWWFRASISEGHLHAEISRQPFPDGSGVGPLPSSFRYVHASLMRCMFKWAHPDALLADFPLGALNATVPPVLRWQISDHAAQVANSLRRFVVGESGELLDLFAATLEADDGGRPAELDYWLAELEALRKFAAKKLRSDGGEPLASPLPARLLPPLLPGL